MASVYQRLLPAILLVVVGSVRITQSPRRHLKANPLVRPRIIPPDTCRAIRTAAEAGVEIRDTGVYGLGAFATKVIEADCRIGDYEGERLTLRMVRARIWGELPMSNIDNDWVKSRRLR
jgi:hypothetical protein